MIRNSILAGFLVGIGNMVYMSCDNKYIGALLFSVALMSVIFYELPLFTGRVGSMIRDRSYIICLIILCLNVSGSIIATMLFTLISPDNKSKIVAIAEYKFSREYIALFVAAILCNVLIHLAVRSKHSILTILCIMTFILCGFEHSIADAGYLVSTKYIIPWLVVVAGNIVGGIVTFYLLHEEDTIEDIMEEDLEEEYD